MHLGPNHQRWKDRIAVLGGLLMAVGFLSFAAQAASASGALNWLPSSFEWPGGYCDGILTLTNGTHVVPITSSGRVQLYDVNWRFLRGWPVNSSAGTFKLEPVDDTSFRVITARMNAVYLYSVDGKLIRTSGYAPPSLYMSIPKPSGTKWIATWPWLLTLTSPSIAWAVGMLGLLILGFKEKLLD